ncbi:MAG TPA: glycosyltransferase family 87 protein [Isosphaeraceae bacterium]|nr:glycosyltransferase family 87 protein [Isosphaeraceae bacterium]
MAQLDRTRLHALLAVCVVLTVAWVGLARWVVPPLLVAQRPGPAVAALQRYLQGYITPYTGSDLPGRWAELSVAVGIAALLHLTILGILRREDRRAEDGRTKADGRGGRGVRRAQSLLALVFLAVTVLTWPRHDYYYYLQMWYEVRQGHDPWWLVHGRFGDGPLNAYGPVFNLLAGLAWLNPLAPKLLFADAYILFTIATIQRAAAGRRLSGLEALAILALFWNPFPWVEIAIRGHFDILVGLLCLAAVHARLRDRDLLAEVSLVLGVLLKYFPIVILPFLALDRGRLRLRFLGVALAAIALGLALSYHLWGLSVFRPLAFAVNRPSTTLSIFWFLRTRYSPLKGLGAPTNWDSWSPYLLFLGLFLAWSWSRARRPSLEASTAVAALTTVLLYRVGFSQYQMVPFVLASSWVLRNWGQLRGRALLGVALGGYVTWLATFEAGNFYYGDESGTPTWAMVEDFAGLVTFLLGCLLLAAMGRSSTPEDPLVVQRPADRHTPHQIQSMNHR